MKKSILVLILITSLVSGLSCNQDTSSIWSKVYQTDNQNETVIDLIETEDGFLILGEENPVGRPDIDVVFLSRYNFKGEEIWNKQFKEFTGINGVFADSDGSIFVFGYTHPTYTGNFTDEWFYNAVMVKFDKDGHELWSKRIETGYTSGEPIERNSNGNFIISGYNQDLEEFRIMMIDGTSQTLWEDVIKTPDTGRFTVKSIDVDTILVTSYLRDEDVFQFTIFTTVENDTRSINVRIPGEYGTLMNVADIRNGSFLATWMYKSSAFTRGIYIVEFNEDLEVLWEKNLGEEFDNHFSDVCITRNGDIILVLNILPENLSLESEYQIRIVSLDKNGNLRWDKIFGANDAGEYSFVTQVTQTEHLVLVGIVYTSVSPFQEGQYSFIRKLDEEGNEVFYRVLGDEKKERNRIVDFLVMPDENFILAGTVTRESSDEKPQNDILIMKCDADGRFKKLSFD
jgi:hypothetical protein